MVTLSFVITGWEGESSTCSFTVTVFMIFSTTGSLKCSHAFQVVLYLPRNSITYS